MQSRRSEEKTTRAKPERKATGDARASVRQSMRRALAALGEPTDPFAHEISRLLLRAEELASVRPLGPTDMGRSVSSPRPAKLACLVEQAGRTNPKLRNAEYGLRSSALAGVILTLFPEFASSPAARAGRAALATQIERVTADVGAPIDVLFDTLNAPAVARARASRALGKPTKAELAALVIAEAEAARLHQDAVARAVAQKALHAAAGAGAMTKEINALFGSIRQRASRSQKAKRSKR